MRTIQQDKAPVCDICKEAKEIVYDAYNPINKIYFYICDKCKKDYPNIKLQTRVKKADETFKLDIPKPDRIETAAVPLTLDTVVEVNCPYCNSSRSVEPDAHYTVTCEACGWDYKVESMI